MFDRVATREKDEKLLSRFFSEVSGEVIDKLREFISTGSLTADHLNITLELSGSYDETLSPSVVEDLKEAMAAGVTSRWLEVTFPEKSSGWEERRATLLNRAFSKICHRRKPQRKS